jgi:hypothetical protein
MKKYIHLKTNSLVTLVGRTKKEKIDWEAMGTSVTSIQLDSTMTSQDVDGVLNYIVPVVNEGKAYEFKLKCEALGIPVEIIEETEAVEKKEVIKSKAEIKKVEEENRNVLIDKMLKDMKYLIDDAEVKK